MKKANDQDDSIVAEFGMLLERPVWVIEDFLELLQCRVLVRLP